MNQNRLFQQTRRQLALWFIVVMGTILIICEFSLYQMVAHAHRVTVDRELTSVANTIHNGFSTLLTQPGSLQLRLSPGQNLKMNWWRRQCIYKELHISFNTLYITYL